MGEGRGHRGNVQTEPFTQLSIDLNALIANDALQHTVLHGPNVCLVPCVAHEVDGRKDAVTTHLANVGDGCLDCCAAIGPHIIAMEGQIPTFGFWLTDGGIALAKLVVRDTLAKDVVPVSIDSCLVFVVAVGLFQRNVVGCIDLLRLFAFIGSLLQGVQVNIVPLRPVRGIDIDVSCCRCGWLVVDIVKNTVTGCEHRKEPTAYNSLYLAYDVRHLFI